MNQNESVCQVTDGTVDQDPCHEHFTMAVAPQDLCLILVADPPEQDQGVLQGVDLDHLVLTLQVDLVVGLLVMVGLLIMDSYGKRYKMTESLGSLLKKIELVECYRPITNLVTCSKMLWLQFQFEEPSDEIRNLFCDGSTSG